MQTRLPVHALPHEPQCAVLVCVSAQMPAQDLSSMAHTQLPAMQVVPIAVHSPPGQQGAPATPQDTQIPPAQSCPAAQACPHVPQLAASVAVSVQVVLQ